MAALSDGDSGDRATATATPLPPAPAPTPESIKVYLRLRPKNNLETMKRGKDCIELHEDPKTITVDSPRLGEHKFSLDRVFDEFATQDEVFRDALAEIPSRLVGGTSATVVAYGQSGSGKTHTLLGEERGTELVALASGDGGGDPSLSPDPRKHPSVTAGMIPRLVAHIFELLYSSAPSDSAVEFSVRCSYAEVYLDRIRDLLRPGRSPPRVAPDDDEGGGRGGGGGFLVGATELCCVCPEDVYALLARGQALRTKAASDEGVDSGRSHAVFSMRLERTDKATGELRTSRLQVFDLAGSQGRVTKTTKTTSTTTTTTSTSTNSESGAIDAERNLANASLASFHRLVRATLQQQKQQQQKQQQQQQSKETKQQSKQQLPKPLPNLSKIARLLRPSIGGKTHTTVICTGSPSSYSSDETIQTISFGRSIQQITNLPGPEFEGYTMSAYRERLSLAEHREKKLTRFLRLVAQECKHGKKKSRDPKNPRVWEAVLKIVEAEKARKNEDRDNNNNNNNNNTNINTTTTTNFTISIGGDKEDNDREPELEELRARLAETERQLREERTARERVESAYRDVTSELVSVKSRQESAAKQKLKLGEELEAQKAKQRKLAAETTELEHQLRTSRFRENESILFLRQFRTFYFRLLHNTASHGNGPIRKLIEDAKLQMPGTAPDLEDLLDVDRMMVKSGIIESSEIGADTPTADYVPSGDALTKSASEAKKAEERELAWIGSERLSDEFGTPPSGLTRGQLVACRQKLVLSPAGRLSIEKERELEKNLSSLSQKCIQLQNALSAEKSMVHALTGRQGAMTKMKQIQETRMLKHELDRRTNDLQAIVWSMNELHLVNKNLSSKMAAREQQSSYLSSYLSDMQTRNQRLLLQIEHEEKRLRDENSELRSQLDGIALDLWQLGEQLEKAPLWRCSVPFTGELLDYEEHVLEGRRSEGNLTEEEIDGLIEIVRCTE